MLLGLDLIVGEGAAWFLELLASEGESLLGGGMLSLSSTLSMTSSTLSMTSCSFALSSTSTTNDLPVDVRTKTCIVSVFFSLPCLLLLGRCGSSLNLNCCRIR